LEPYGYIGNVRFLTAKKARLSCGSGNCRKPCEASGRLHWVIQPRKPVNPQHANKTISFGFKVPAVRRNVIAPDTLWRGGKVCRPIIKWRSLLLESSSGKCRYRR